jgi:hypothetical protein
VRAPAPCDLKELQNSEGVTEKKKERLKSKGGLPKTKVGQWNLIYEILFPGDPVPSPCKQAFLQLKRFLPQLCSLLTCPKDQGEIGPTREGSLSNVSRESYTGEAFGHVGEQFTQNAQEITEGLMQGIGQSPTTQIPPTRSRDSDDFRRMEEALEGRRLLERVCSMLESRLPDTILDARDSIIAEEGQSAFLNAQNRTSLPSVDESPFISSLLPRPLAPGWHPAQQMNYANYDYTLIPDCFSVPPPQEPSAQGPGLDQAKGMTLRPDAARSDSDYYSGELIPDPLRPSHETPSIKIAGMNDEVIDDFPAASQDEVPFQQYYLNSGGQNMFD